MLRDEKKYPKYTWINVDAERNTSDFRIESYRPDIASISVEPELPKIRGRVDWDARRRIILDSQKVYTNLDELITEAKDCKKSLAVFKPAEIIDMNTKECSDEWDSDTLAQGESTGSGSGREEEIY